MESRETTTLLQPPAPPRVGMTRLGDQLKAERERRGIVLDDVAQTTKIRKDYLLALERHDWGALPGDVFTQGYLRSYSQCLGLDPAYMLKVYARERRISEAETSSANGNGEVEGEGDRAKAILSRLARTQGADSRGLASGIRWAVLGVCGSVVGAAIIWGGLHFLAPGRGRNRDSRVADNGSPLPGVSSSRPEAVANAGVASAGVAPEDLPGQEGLRGSAHH